MSRMLVLAAIAASFVLSASAPADAQWLRNRINGNVGGNYYGNSNRFGNSNVYGYRNARGTNNFLPVNNGCSYQNQQASQNQPTSDQQSQYQQHAANLRPAYPSQQPARIVFDERTGQTYYVSPNPASAKIPNNLVPAPAAAANVELNSPASDIFLVLSVEQQQPSGVQPATFDAPATNEAPLTISGPATSNSASAIGTGFSALESLSTTEELSEVPEAKSVLDLED